MVASLTPVAAPRPHIIDNPGATAGALLELALGQFRGGNNYDASRAFNRAIETGRLNDAGRALAYWHIFIADRQVGEIDRSTDALASFIVVGEDIFAIRESMRYAVDESGDFADRFGLADKLDQARALISAAWSNRRPAFGHSENIPVRVQSDEEVEYFLGFASPCSNTVLRSVSRRPVNDSMEQITLSCGEIGDEVEFYFERPPR